MARNKSKLLLPPRAYTAAMAVGAVTWMQVRRRLIVLFDLRICYSYVSQFTVEISRFAEGRCLFKQPRSVLYY